MTAKGGKDPASAAAGKRSARAAVTGDGGKRQPAQPKAKAAAKPKAKARTERPAKSPIAMVSEEPREPVGSVHERLNRMPIAAREAEIAPQGPTVQLVTFMLADEEYSIPIMEVQEIIRILNVRITEIPNAPRFIEGVINLRGRILPVVDLRDRFGMEPAQRTRTNRIIVVGVAGRTVGLVVDSVVEVLRIFEDHVEALPELAAGVGTEYVVGVTRVDDRMVIVLDLDLIFSSEEKVSIGTVAHTMEEDKR